MSMQIGQVPSNKISSLQRFSDWLYLAAIMAIVSLLLLLPVFPSGDGAVHLYYSHVLDELLQHQTNYVGYYSIRHLVAPYLVHYAALIALERFISASLAEKIFAALTVLNIGLGFRFLARKLGSNAGLAVLLGVPLLLSFWLVAGFMNYCFAVGVALWCIGFWQDLRRPKAAASFVGFVIGVAILIISHPVPLLLLIGICFIELALVVLERGRCGAVIFEGLRLPIIALCVACAAFVFPILVADKSRVASDALGFGLRKEVLEIFLKGQMLSMFSSPPFIHGKFNMLVAALLPVIAFLALRDIRRHWSGGGLTSVDRLAVAALLLVGFSLLLPVEMNGSEYFSQRMWWMLWLVALATVSGLDLEGRIRPAIFGAGCLLTGLTAYSAGVLLPPVAKQMALIDGIKLPHGGKGLFLESRDTVTKDILGYMVFRWGGVRAFMHSDAVLLNSPWMDTTISPLKAEPDSDLLVNYTDKENLEPFNLISHLNDNQTLKHRVLDSADFIYYIDPNDKSPTPEEDMQSFLSGQNGKWNCQAGTIYALCQRTAPYSGSSEVVSARGTK